MFDSTFRDLCFFLAGFATCATLLASVILCLIRADRAGLGPESVKPPRPMPPADLGGVRTGEGYFPVESRIEPH